MFTLSERTLLPILVNIGDSYFLYSPKISPEFWDIWMYLREIIILTKGGILHWRRIIAICCTRNCMTFWLAATKYVFFCKEGNVIWMNCFACNDFGDYQIKFVFLFCVMHWFFCSIIHMFLKINIILDFSVIINY